MKKCLLFLTLVGLAGCSHSANPAPAKPVEVAAGDIGSHLPEFSVTDMQGREVSSADLHGKVVLIDIWATWCEPCKREMPGYQKLQDRYSSRGFAVIGLKANMMADTEDPLQFAAKLGIHYPLVVATDDLMQKFVGLEGLPTTLLYDRQGVLRKKIIGFEYANVIESEVKPML